VQTCIWPSWCHCHSLSLASVKSRLVLPFCYRLTWVVPEKGQLNVCVCVYVCCICLMYDTNDMDIIRGLGGVIRVGWHWQHRSDVWISEWDVESGQFISQWPLGKRHSWQRGRVICRTRHSACMWRWMERSHSNLWSQYDHCVAGKLGLMCEV